MNILIIGNGFDLAHGLPTKYTDFLKFVEVIKQVISIRTTEDLQRIQWGDIHLQIKNIIQNKMGNISNNLLAQKDMWEELIADNIWIDYFLHNPVYRKENWIDFEREIARVIKSLDNDMIFDDDKRYEIQDKVIDLTNVFLEEKYSEYLHPDCCPNDLKQEAGREITFEEIRNKMYADLNKLIRGLEIYLTEYVGKIKCTMYSEDIKDIATQVVINDKGQTRMRICRVVCFNYTDTYEKIYMDKKQYQERIDYIHGKACINNTIQTNNMVLGIDEYLEDNRKNRDIEFIAFKKYYQRIHKETGCKYKEWVETIRTDQEEYIKRKAEVAQREKIYKEDDMYALKNRIEKLKNDKSKNHYVYIFGHSLDITDGDILKDLILNDNVYTTIYYLNKEVMGQQIANLVRVIGQEELIKRTGGSTKTIEFKLQRDMTIYDNE